MTWFFHYDPPMTRYLIKMPRRFGTASRRAPSRATIFVKFFQSIWMTTTNRPAQRVGTARARKRRQRRESGLVTVFRRCRRSSQKTGVASELPGRATAVLPLARHPRRRPRISNRPPDAPRFRLPPRSVQQPAGVLFWLSVTSGFNGAGCGLFPDLMAAGWLSYQIH